MKINQVTIKLLFSLLLLAVASPLLPATEVFRLNLTVSGLSALACGMDTTSLDGLDSTSEMQDVIAPPSAPAGKLSLKFTNNGFSTGMFKDIRSPANEKTWQLDVSNLPNGTSFEMGWALTAGDPAFFSTNHASLLFKGNAADVKVVDVGTPILTGSITINRNGSFYIALQTGANTQPSAVADQALTLKNQPVTINALANDSDPDGDVLIITATGETSAGGSVAIAADKKTLTYTPPANYSGTYPFDDMFTYTVSDQYAGTGGPGAATGTVTVQVAEVVAARVHTHYGNPGGNLTVTITVAYAFTETADVTPLKIEEFLPAWYDITGSGTTGPWAFIPGTFLPPAGITDATATQPADSSMLTIQFPTVPASPFSFSYQVGVPEKDSAAKFINGQVFAGTAPDPAAEILPTEVIPEFRNLAPVIVAVSPGGQGNTPQDPAPINEGQSLNFSVTAKDDNLEQVEPLTIAAIDWYVDDVLQSGGRAPTIGNFAFVTTFDTIANDISGHRPKTKEFEIKAVVLDHYDAEAEIVWQVTVNDSDQLPTAPVVALDPAAPKTLDEITAAVTADATDADGDAITGYTYSWSKGETVIPGAILAAGQTLKNDQWTMTVKALTNPYGDGNIESTNPAIVEVTIGNTAPVANGQSVTTQEDIEKAIALTGTDQDVVELMDTLTFAISTGPEHGSLPDFNTVTGAVTYRPAANYHGPDSFYFTVTDGADTSAPAKVDMTIDPVADTPAVTPATTNEDIQTTSGLVISRNAADGAEVTHFKITGITNGSLFKNDGTTGIANGAFIAYAEGNAGLKFTPALNYFGNAGFTVQASVSNIDAGLGGAPVNAAITVNAVADTPPITPATTNEDTQTTSGLVINRNFNDGAEVTHFKITGITNGSLFKNDGTTGIANGTFITFAEANAGLKFTPAPNYFGNASFIAQASVSNADAGLGGGQALATITVYPVADTPSATPATTLEDVMTDTGLVLSRNAADGAEATHFKITGIINGQIFKNDGITGIADGSFITYAEGHAGLKFMPAPDYFGNAGFTVQSSLDATNAGLGGAQVPVIVTVSPVNDPPVFTLAGTAIAARENAGTVTVPNWLTSWAPGPANESLTQTVALHLVNDNPGLFALQPELDIDTGSLTYALNADVAAGSAQIQVWLTDNGNNSTLGDNNTSITRGFTITVDGWAVKFTLTGGAQPLDAVAGMSSTGPADSVLADGAAIFFFSAAPSPAPADAQYASDYRGSIKTEETWYLQVKAANLAGSLVLSWNQSQLPHDKVLAIYELDSNSVVKAETFRHLNLLFAGQNEIALAGGVNRTYAIRFTTTIEAGEIVDLIPFAQGWNLISLPMNPQSVDFADVLKDTNGKIYAGDVYQYERGYFTVAPTPTALRGFWVYAAAAKVIRVSGTPLADATVHLSRGWNIFGPAVHRSVPTTIFGSAWFRRGTAYRRADFLETTRGYWFFVKESAGISINLGQ